MASRQEPLAAPALPPAAPAPPGVPCRLLKLAALPTLCCCCSCALAPGVATLGVAALLPPVVTRGLSDGPSPGTGLGEAESGAAGAAAAAGAVPDPRPAGPSPRPMGPKARPPSPSSSCLCCCCGWSEAAPGTTAPDPALAAAIGSPWAGVRVGPATPETACSTYRVLPLGSTTLYVMFSQDRTVGGCFAMPATPPSLSYRCLTCAAAAAGVTRPWRRRPLGETAVPGLLPGLRLPLPLWAVGPPPASRGCSRGPASLLAPISSSPTANRVTAGRPVTAV